MPWLSSGAGFGAPLVKWRPGQRKTSLRILMRLLIAAHWPLEEFCPIRQGCQQGHVSDAPFAWVAWELMELWAKSTKQTHADANPRHRLECNDKFAARKLAMPAARYISYYGQTIESWGLIFQFRGCLCRCCCYSPRCCRETASKRINCCFDCTANGRTGSSGWENTEESLFCGKWKSRLLRMST